MGNKLYIGSLPYSTTEQRLTDLFSQYGTVQSAKVITDRFSGQSRGLAFVEVATSEEAQKAIAELHGTELGGRRLWSMKPVLGRSDRLVVEAAAIEVGGSIDPDISLTGSHRECLK